MHRDADQTKKKKDETSLNRCFGDSRVAGHLRQKSAKMHEKVKGIVDSDNREILSELRFIILLLIATHFVALAHRGGSGTWRTEV